MILWNREELQTLGAVAFLPPQPDPCRAGRHVGSHVDSPSSERDGNDNRTPIQLTSHFKNQLEIEVEDNHLVVKNIGRCPLQLNGIRRSEGQVEVGQMIELEREIILLVTRRSRHFPEVNGFTHPFGMRDPYGFTGESPGTGHSTPSVNGFSHDGSCHHPGCGWTGRERLALALNGRPFPWRESHCHADNLWVDDPHAWFEQRPEQAEAGQR